MMQSFASFVHCAHHKAKLGENLINAPIHYHKFTVDFFDHTNVKLEQGTIVSIFLITPQVTIFLCKSQVICPSHNHVQCHLLILYQHTFHANTFESFPPLRFHQFHMLISGTAHDYSTWVCLNTVFTFWHGYFLFVR